MGEALELLLSFRRMAVLPLCAVMSSCGSAPAPAGATEDVATLLSKNDPAACALDEAVDTAIAAANKHYVDYLQNGGEKIRADAISATNIRTDIHEITCSAVIHNKIPGRDGEQSNPFVFKLRPTLGKDAGSFVAEVPDIRRAANAVTVQMAWWNALNSATDMAAAPSTEDSGDAPAPATTPTSDQDVPDEPTESWTPIEKAMIEEYSTLDGQCRGGLGDAPETQRACAERDREDSPLKRRLRAAEICYGREGEYGYQNDFHRCGRGSFRF